ncbi:sensor histidine kinase [Sphingomonas oryzagri]|jgi:signal transduction histidine kinase|uniref:histidine kinase n=1 Tax=Sphingomonas oryzagri TaxID=3042314 RepID=A0ABT6N1C1_9SPHN|nr:HAMP domain-containing sensor histidine kinase [Sphingomonas oryzagri]MDH7639099.1 HAMP domain-containing sensor histidine kinase [Sphingomonas oryzagri]
MLADRLRIRDIRNTSTFRLTLLFGVVFLVGVTILLGLIYGLSARELTRRSDHILRQEAAMLEKAPAAALPSRIRSEIERSAGGLSYFELRSTDGDHVAGNLRVASMPPLDTPVEREEGAVAKPVRLLAVETPSEETLLIGRDISPVVDLRNHVLMILIASGLLTAIAVLVCGILLSIAPLRRVRDLQRAIETISAGDMEARMPLAGRHDELDLFAGTVNQMIDEIERAIAQVKGVTDAIAHDLRTPLTRVRSQLYRLSQSPDMQSPAARMVGAATADLDIVLDRFAALLRISELEASRRRAGFAPVDLHLLLARTHELYEPLAEDQDIALSIESTGPVIIAGDEKLLFEALSNLVDNALKFTPAGGTVELALLETVRGPMMEVRDSGPGIAADERQAVIRRFHRGSNAADVPGTGLGLSLVVAILHLHGFELAFRDRRPGLVVEIRCTTPEEAGAVKFISLAPSGQQAHLDDAGQKAEAV